MKINFNQYLMNDYNLMFAILTAIGSAGISYGVLKNQINVNTSNILTIQKVITTMNDLKNDIELNKRDVEVLKEHNINTTSDIKTLKDSFQKVEINVALILQKVDDLSKKIA